MRYTTMLNSMLLTMVDCDRKASTATFEPQDPKGYAFRNRPTIKATIADGKEDLFFKAISILPHTVKIFKDDNILSIRFTLDCTVEIFYNADDDGQHIVIHPSFEDTDLFNASEFIRMHRNGKVERQICFTCDMESKDNINDRVSDR